MTSMCTFFGFISFVINIMKQPIVTPPPTPPPTALTAPPVAISACGTCPSSSWGMLPATLCTGFYHCEFGKPTQYVKCAPGTLYDADIKGCDWDYRVTCTCGVAPPTPVIITGPVPAPGSPTPPVTPITNPPTPPTASTGGIWYPDWERTNTCQNDGLQPGWMASQYFSSSQSRCCSQWFWWDDACN